MSRILKSTTSLALALSLAVVLLSAYGCGSSENPPATNPAPAAAAAPVSQPSAGPPVGPPIANPAAESSPIENLAPPVAPEQAKQPKVEHAVSQDYSSLLFVFMLATFIGLGVILRVSRLLHTPLMSLTNAISAIAVVGSIIVTGSEGYSPFVRFLGGVALFASMTNIVSGFLITDRMLKMFKSPGQGGKR
jgi:proton-translocating NAD(P)+ transhydrogenase subunit alpha